MAQALPALRLHDGAGLSNVWGELGWGEWVAPVIGAGGERGHGGSCTPPSLWQDQTPAERMRLPWCGLWGSHGFDCGVLVALRVVCIRAGQAVWRLGWVLGHGAVPGGDWVRGGGGETSSHLLPPQRSCPVPANRGEVSPLLHPAGGHRRRRCLLQGEQVCDELPQGTARVMGVMPGTGSNLQSCGLSGSEGQAAAPGQQEHPWAEQ